MSASTTRQIGGVLLKPDATPFSNSSVTIYRDKRQVTPTADAAIVDEVLRTVTGPGGEVSMALVPGKYLGQVRLSDADRYFSFTVPDGAGPFPIQDLIDQSPVTGEQFVRLQDLVLAARAWAEKPEDEEVVEGGYSARHWAAKSHAEAEAAAEAVSHAAEWAQSDAPISTEAGGDGSTDRSAKWWAGQSEQIALPDGSIVAKKLAARLSARIGAMFDSVADLLADTTLSYGDVSEGDIIEAGGFRYEVAASDATDAHVETAGGVKLYVLPDADGYYPAGAFANTLNDAMAVINSAFSDRIGISVPPGMSITDTVILEVPCDLRFGGWCSVDADMERIFDPQHGWEGTASPCEIRVNNRSCGIGWNFVSYAPEGFREFGVVVIDRHTFRVVGDPVAGTSADSWVGFHIPTMGIKKIDLYKPTTIDSYVKPNGIEGDAIGPNRCIVIAGLSGHTLISDINIYNPVAINLTPSEDADGLTINVGSTFDHPGVALNIDVHGGHYYNSTKRAIKIVGQKPVSGIRFHGEIYAEVTDTTRPRSAIQVSGPIDVDWNGVVIARGEWYDVWNVLDGAYIRGNVRTDAVGPLEGILNATARQAVTLDDARQFADRDARMEVGPIYKVGGYYAVRVFGGCALIVDGKITYEGCNQLAYIKGTLKASALISTIIPGGDAEAGEATRAFLGDTDSIVEIDYIEIKNSSGGTIPHGVQLLGNGSVLRGGKFSGFSVSSVRLDNIDKVRLESLSAPDGLHLIRGYGAGGKVAIIGCGHPTSVWSPAPGSSYTVEEVGSLDWG
jgi:hypothetical protein